MMEPAHISEPIKVVLEVIYVGRNWNQAIEAELKRRGLSLDQVQTIICIPAEMATDDNRQMQLFQ